MDSKAYFNYYGMLMHQQNMLQDFVRTNAYFQAVMENAGDFAGKVVLDVGAGSGILSFFAAQAGAKRVYAVEASPMAKHAENLVKANGFSDVIKVIHGRIEDTDLPEPVDIIISEPMGVLLLHERMIESMLYARDRFLLKNTGKLYPSYSSIYLAPFTDSQAYVDTMGKARFWEQNMFFGVNFKSLRDTAVRHYFAQPVVGTFDPKILLSREPVKYDIDLSTIPISLLLNLEIPLVFKADATAIMHGLAGWFDVQFMGCNKTTILTTSPFSPATHWHQIRFFFTEPIALNTGDIVRGTLKMQANDNRSYDIEITISLPNNPVSRKTFKYALHEQQYNYTSPIYSDPALFKPEYIGVYPQLQEEASYEITDDFLQK